MHSWAPLQVLHGDTDVLFPVSGVASYSPADAPLGSLENGTGPEDHVLPEPGPRYSVEASPPCQGSPLSSLLPSASMPESMTVVQLVCYLKCPQERALQSFLLSGPLFLTCKVKTLTSGDLLGAVSSEPIE
ncbi:sorting nexin-29-like [Leptonychotes weddellii]|uniref:Sorting nexin-29-like n=1 Tax=Leptonychotes weddellii TaxID=9713 RepID=A0A7F8Q9F6_LEPWE|nr:sorting nexin-29-like [Leptonychotes weddellii]